MFLWACVVHVHLKLTWKSCGSTALKGLIDLCAAEMSFVLDDN